ncbi:MAG TPA: HypC/HybG/HupF family hydrogenase formation chaperone [Candidatus Glassbacteria bacterium]|nr:HypC/HybG/HupF family hydrogenase formation chaperone [Candidatus Glassbacteria bacterium]
MCLGIPGRVENISGSTAKVSFGGALREVSLDLVDEPVARGDYLLVHAGFALERIDEREALETLALLKEAMGLETP